MLKRSVITPSDLGDNFTVSVNNQTYKVSKMKINKKIKRIQIIKPEGVTTLKSVKVKVFGDKPYKAKKGTAIIP